MAEEFCPKMLDFHVIFRDLLHATNLRHGTNGFTSLPKEGVLKIFSALKIPKDSAGIEPANLGTKGQHTTSRSPKPLTTKINKSQLSNPSSQAKSGPHTTRDTNTRSSRGYTVCIKKRMSAP